MLKVGLLGEKLGHSLSPQIHQKFGSDYKLFEVEKDKLQGFLQNCELDGFNVTVPYKQAVMPYLDEIDLAAQEIGAVNTVLKLGDKLVGYNTDADGMIFALKRAKIDLKDKVVAILGTGGTSNTAYYVAKKLGAKKIFKVGRTSEINYSNLYDEGEINVIINTTPVGMFPNVNEAACNVEKVRGLEGVFDAVYNPLQTKLTSDAKALKVKSANGLAMLVEQARISHNIFVNSPNSDEKSDFKIGEQISEKIVDELYLQRINLVLIGMPSSGKTTIGKLLSKRLNKQFIDLDEYITQKTGESVEQIFAQGGEKLFREIEENASLETGKMQNLVIASGGGTVCFGKSADYLKLNGKFIYIKRDLDKLISNGRPLSKSVGVEKLFEMRKDIYESKADFSLKNESVETTVEEIIKYYEKNISY